MNSTEKIKLTKIELSGYRSFNTEKHSITFNDITVLIGPNGAGKSNLISLFEMLNYLTTSAIQNYIASKGFASSLLYYGLNKSNPITIKITFSNSENIDSYEFVLAKAVNDRLIFTSEIVEWQNKKSIRPYKIDFNPGVLESELLATVLGKNNYTLKQNELITCKVVLGLLSKCKVFHFHDTSSEAFIRNSADINNNQYLYANAGNLASYLYMLKSNNSYLPYYNRIVQAVKGVLPQFNDFVLEPDLRNNSFIRLNWRDSDANYIMGPHQISDGSLRFMALATLLLQPPTRIPSVIILDEPELGLHPSALSSLVGLIRIASENAQVIIATQSPALLDEFEPENIVVVERDELKKSSMIRQFSNDDLSNWIDDYSLSEIWEKNIIGGKP